MFKENETKAQIELAIGKSLELHLRGQKGKLTAIMTLEPAIPKPKVSKPTSCKYQLRF